MALPPPTDRAIALVTGASSGIGEQFARALARRGHAVGLVARRRQRLDALAGELHDQHGVRAEVLEADLADPAARDALAGRVADLGLDVDVLVNNAGFGIYGPFADSDRERELQQVRVDVEAVVDLCARYVPGMVERGRGAIVNVSSTAGLQPLPGNAGYAAAKAHVLSFSEALHAELGPRGVTVTAVLPGPVRTEFQERNDPRFAERMPGIVWAGPERVAEDGLRAAERGKRSVIPGGVAVRASFAGNRYAPPALALRVGRLVMGPDLRKS